MDSSLRHTLHERGLRMTPQRQLVLDAVRELGHATPEQVCAAVQRAAPAVNITTVYRTLDLLEQLGMVQHTHLGHGAPSYSPEKHEHVHLVCHNCGEVIEIDTELLDELAGRLRDRYGFLLDAAHVGLTGTCRNCADGGMGAVMTDGRAGSAQPTDGPTTDGPTTNRATTDGATTDGAPTDRATADRATTDRATADRATTDRATTDRATVDTANPGPGATP